MSRTLHRVAWLLAILSTQPSVWGHHSISAVFDETKFITSPGR